MELSLGRFGDRRLEKGGPIFWAALWGLVAASFGFGVWAAVGRGRFA